MDLKSFKRLPILGILRGVDKDVIDSLTEAMVSPGLKTVEITMNTKDAPDCIKSMVKAAKGRLTIGAGTVLTVDAMQEALDAGATFIVMPTLVPEVMEYCAKKSIPAFPGALTPQEIYNAWRAGAAMVKVFPSKFFGPSYIKEIKGPFQDIELLACGGVTPDNIKDHFSSGASAVAFGGSIFKKEWLDLGKFGNIEKSIRTLLTNYL
ncbi:MAG: bifunctional 4-hydroxy-2-oxoglutarate aldolase/2-dehydro-3-deoxy-phosphogluconate aldolase [Candidatus Omnitrophica bacterium]|nr:bifunctional 4-hydroxy-2-oxoglutarate aldolase/2-dehydro-3-deoxy-phosphogluconate aldolase [Candidatus Omnitrophota bacterium]